MMVRMRIVLDTNVLIDGFQDDYCAEARLIDAVREGSIMAIATRPVRKEYQLILHRLISDPDYKKRIEEFFSALEEAEPEYVDVAIDDEEDMKFLEAAFGGEVDAVVTNDRHLLDIGEADGVNIITPEEAIGRYEEEGETSTQWQSLVSGWGIGTHHDSERGDSL